MKQYKSVMIILNDTSITLPLFSNSYVECRGVDKGTNIVLFSLIG